MYNAATGFLVATATARERSVRRRAQPRKLRGERRDSSRLQHEPVGGHGVHTFQAAQAEAHDPCDVSIAALDEVIDASLREAA